MLRGRSTLRAAAFTTPERLERPLGEADVEDEGERAAALDSTHGPRPTAEALSRSRGSAGPGPPHLRVLREARALLVLSPPTPPQRAGSGLDRADYPLSASDDGLAHGCDRAPSGPTQIQPLEERVPAVR